jgi:hypothetical protein
MTAKPINRKNDKPVSVQGYDALQERFSLPWSAYVRLLSLKSKQARAFYEEEALRGGRPQ